MQDPVGEDTKCLEPPGPGLRYQCEELKLDARSSRHTKTGGTSERSAAAPFARRIPPTFERKAVQGEQLKT